MISHKRVGGNLTSGWAITIAIGYVSALTSVVLLRS
jgi:hypothetical protein